MTGTVRELWRRMPRAASLGTLDASRGDPSPVLTLEVTVPTGFGLEGATRLEGELRRLVGRQISDIGASRDLDVQVREAAGPDGPVEISCGGRPLLVQPAQAGRETQVPIVLDSVNRALLRRPALLLDPAHARAFGAALAGRLRDSRTDLYRGIARYVVEAGTSLSRLRNVTGLSAVHTCESTPEIGEVLIDAVSPHSIVVDVPEPTLRAVDSRSADALVRRRTDLHSSVGLEFPDVEVRRSDDPAGVVRIRLNGIGLQEVRLGEESTWADVVDLLGRTLAGHASWFVRSRDIARARSRSSATLPDLVALSEATWPAPLLSACIRSMVGNEDSVRNLSRILWLLLEADPRGAPPDSVWLPEVAASESGTLAERMPDVVVSNVRRRIAFDAWQVAAPDPIRYVALPRNTEDALVTAGDDLGDIEWRVIRSLARLSPPYTVVTHGSAALPVMRSAVEALPTVPRVIAVSERPPDAAPLEAVPLH
jgi:hypothetical protein